MSLWAIFRLHYWADGDRMDQETEAVNQSAEQRVQAAETIRLVHMLSAINHMCLPDSNEPMRPLNTEYRNAVA